MAEKIYLLGPGAKPEPLEETAFDQEVDLQSCLAHIPNSLTVSRCGRATRSDGCSSNARWVYRTRWTPRRVGPSIIC